MHLHYCRARSFSASSTSETVTIANMVVWAERWEKYSINQVLMVNPIGDEPLHVLQESSISHHFFERMPHSESRGWIGTTLPAVYVALLQATLIAGEMSLDMRPSAAVVCTKDQVCAWMDGSNGDQRRRRCSKGQAHSFLM
jgi:hypothetical protein